MKIYVGDVIKDAVNDPKQPIPKTKIADMIEISRTQFYAILSNPEMDIDYLAKIARAIGKDFSDLFPELKTYQGVYAFHEPEPPYGEVPKLTKDLELIELQRKYIRVLEDNNELRKELRAYEKEKSK